MTVDTPRPSLNRLSRFDWRLWNRFVAIAQPYWFPTENGGGKVFFGLLALLLVFLFAFLFVVVAATTWLCQQIFPEFMGQTAEGLVGNINGILNSPFIYAVAAGIIVPLIAAFALRDRILPRWQQWALLTLLLLLLLSVSGMNVIISYVGNFFTTALAEKDAPTFWRFFWVYAGVFAIATPFIVYYRYVQDLLGLRWREWMTNNFLGEYFNNRAYYEINSEEDIDNPDQRISEDINNFTSTSLRYLLLLLGSVIDVLAFTGILWALSRNLAIFLLIYALFGTVIVAFLARKLISLNFIQLRREADFRYGLVHVRDNAESIAFYQGESQEQGQLSRRFIDVLRNFNFLIGWQRNLSFFRTPYRFLTYILPSVILAPMLFADQIKFGDITQAGFAFSQIFEAFAVVVIEINDLSSFAAGINRLETFEEALDAQANPPTAATTIDTTERQRRDTPISLEHVTLMTPKGQRMLISDLSAELEPGKGLVIVGQSGAGKSSLLRAIAGLWDTGTGRIIRPDLAQMLFLPQRPYMVLGTLRDQLLYPNLAADTDESQLRQALQQVNLADLAERVGGFNVELTWADVLSLGEQQRLAFARLVLSKPPYVVLDEATSALDLSNEKRLYDRLRESATTFISVGHRPSLLKYHDYVLELTGDTHWNLTRAEDYTATDQVFS